MKDKSESFLTETKYKNKECSRYAKDAKYKNMKCSRYAKGSTDAKDRRCSGSGVIFGMYVIQGVVF